MARKPGDLRVDSGLEKVSRTSTKIIASIFIRPNWQDSFRTHSSNSITVSCRAMRRKHRLLYRYAGMKIHPPLDYRIHRRTPARKPGKKSPATFRILIEKVTGSLLIYAIDSADSTSGLPPEVTVGSVFWKEPAGGPVQSVRTQNRSVWKFRA